MLFALKVQMGPDNVGDAAPVPNPTPTTDEAQGLNPTPDIGLVNPAVLHAGGSGGGVFEMETGMTGGVGLQLTEPDGDRTNRDGGVSAEELRERAKQEIAMLLMDGTFEGISFDYTAQELEALVPIGDLSLPIVDYPMTNQTPQTTAPGLEYSLPNPNEVATINPPLDYSMHTLNKVSTINRPPSFVAGLPLVVEPPVVEPPEQAAVLVESERAVGGDNGAEGSHDGAEGSPASEDHAGKEEPMRKVESKEGKMGAKKRSVEDVGLEEPVGKRARRVNRVIREVPEWVQQAHTYLMEGVEAKEWKDCVESWYRFETTCVGDRLGRLPAASACPAELSRWFQTQSYTNMPLVDDVVEFGGEWIEWWNAMQPPVRRSVSGMPKPFEAGMTTAMGCLQKPGNAGIVVVLVGLKWWADGGERWLKAVGDMTACLDLFAGSG